MFKSNIKSLAMRLFLLSVLVFVMNGCGKKRQEVHFWEPMNKYESDEGVRKDETFETDSSDIHSAVSDENVSSEQTDSNPVPQNDIIPSPKKETHTHSWVAQTKTVLHAEEGHYETRVIQEAYDEEVYGNRTFCNGCKDPATGKPLDITGSPWDHVISVCGGGYYADRVVVNTIHHEAVTEQVWVVDKGAWTETVTIGYQCSCGASK